MRLLESPQPERIQLHLAPVLQDRSAHSSESISTKLERYPVEKAPEVPVRGSWGLARSGPAVLADHGFRWNGGQGIQAAPGGRNKSKVAMQNDHANGAVSFAISDTTMFPADDPP
jgi:hypothetical protein